MIQTKLGRPKISEHESTRQYHLRVPFSLYKALLRAGAREVRRILYQFFKKGK